ncbi:MAG: FG-GAP-like repeat-containing protein, partial [Candidatus Njordarchaeales archaeon]
VADLNNDGIYEVIVATRMGTIFVLNGLDGSLMQHYHILSLRSSPIIVNIDNDEDLEVLLMDNYGNLYFLDFMNNSISRIAKLPSRIDYSLSPIVADLDGDGVSEIIVGAVNGGVYVVRSSDGTLLWSAKTNGSIVSNPVIGDFNGDNILDVVVGSTDGCAYIFSGEDGSLLWWFRTGSSISKSPVIADIDGDRLNELIVASDDGYVYAFDFKNSGSRIYWSMFRGTPDNIGNQACVDGDLDLLSDYTESIIGSDPQNPDTDSDGLPDWWEFIYDTNILENDSALDPDNDNLTNYQEFVYGTDPRNNDTDNDYLPDYWEILNNLDPRNATDSILDVDNDYLVNWQEYKYGTDPWEPDTDGDGFNDGEEVFQGYDPLDPNSHPLVSPFQKTPVLAYYLGIIGALCVVLLSLGYFGIRRLRLRREMHRKALRALFDFMNVERRRIISDAFQEKALSNLSPRVVEGVRYYVSTGDAFVAARLGGLSLDEFDDLRVSLNIPRVVFYEEEEE